MSLYYHGKDELRRLAEDPETFGTVLYAIALKLFGPEIHGWEPEMFDLEFRDELQVEMPQGNQDRLIALVLAIAGNRFYLDHRVFTHTCELLSGNEADFDTLTPDLLPAEMAWGTFEVKLNDDDEPAFDDDVASYVGVILHEDGMVEAPAQLEYAHMPEVYLGSTAGDVVGQMGAQTSRQEQVINTYLGEQVRELVAQIRSLPWATGDLMRELDAEFREATAL